MASGTTKLTLSTQDYVKVKTVGGEVLQGRVHALCESTSTLVIRLAGAGTSGGKEGEREGVGEGGGSEGVREGGKDRHTPQTAFEDDQEALRGAKGTKGCWAKRCLSSLHGS
ncbi:hypothetical protein Naga_100595g2, partial [Nannochloropsis gaditana]